MITEERVLALTPPPGARFKGYKDVIVQDLRLAPVVIRYRRQRWQMSDGRTLVAPLPPGIAGHFGPELRRFVLVQHHQGQVTTERLTRFLNELGLVMSKRQVVRLLNDRTAAFVAEAKAVLGAGLDHAGGDAVIPIDADLQDPPELIPDLVAKWREGNDVVLAVRSDRSSDGFAKRTTAGLFYRMIGRLSEVPIPANAGDFRLMDRCVVKALKRLPERSRFTKGLFAWLGFKQATVTYVRPGRFAGTGKWKPWKLWNFALDDIVSFTTLPLRVWTYCGLAVAFLALGYMAFIVLRTLIQGVEVPGYASIVAMLLFFSGLNMLGLGIIGEYLGRVFVEVKQRPLYLVRDAVGIEPDLEDAAADHDASGLTARG